MKPLFSIVIPSYNRSTLLEQCIRAILAQKEQRFEIVVVDDGSTDNTEELVDKYKCSDARIRYFKKENEERAIARNFGARKARGAYINFFDSDDIMYSNHLSNAAFIVSRHHRPPVFHVGYEIVDTYGKVIKQVTEDPGNFKKRLAYENFLSCNSVFVRSDVANEYQFNEETNLLTSEDYELWLRIASKYPFVSDRTISYKMVEHESRSLNLIKTQKVKEKYVTMIETLLLNESFTKSFAKHINYFVSSKYSYLALVYSEGNCQRKEAWTFLLKSIWLYQLSIFSRRTWAIIRNLVTCRL